MEHDATRVGDLEEAFAPGLGLDRRDDLDAVSLEAVVLVIDVVDAALTFLLEFVQAAARAATNARAACDDSRMDDADWWETNAPLLAQIFDESAYPRAVRIGAAAGAAQGGAYNAERAYRFGLQRVLDGLSELIDQEPTTAEC